MVTLAPTLAAAGATLLAAGCHDAPSGAPPEPVAACTRAFGEKLGVPFVRVCPDDLPGVIRTPFWIAAAPVGCTKGEHGTVACPPVVALSPPRDGPPTIAARHVQVIDAVFAHRTCMLRFGGRLPTSAERAQAHDALGLDTVAVSAGSEHLDFSPLAEWTTDRACLDPSTLGTCTPTKFPTGASSDIDWTRIRSCSATPTATAGALVVGPGEACPLVTNETAPRCLLGSVSSRRAFELACRTLTAEEASHPDPQPGERAAFRCVVPDGALVGTYQ